MDMDDIKQMAVKLAMLIDSFERRGEHVEQIVSQAAQSMMQAAKTSETVAERTTNQALQDFRQAAVMQLGDGLREPIERVDRTLRTSMQSLHAATHALEQQQLDANRVRKRDAWKVFIASTLASLVMLGGGIYTIVKAREESVNAHWASSVDAAIKAGRLVPCAGDGICVYAGNQWMRLDSMEAPREAARKKK